MKILVLESSGNKHGSSNMLAEAFIRGTKENGHDITEFDAGEWAQEQRIPRKTTAKKRCFMAKKTFRMIESNLLAKNG